MPKVIPFTKECYDVIDEADYLPLPDYVPYDEYAVIMINGVIYNMEAQDEIESTE